MLERYAIIERMAVGGMGEVFLARQEGVGGFRRTVVIKKLLPNVEGSDDAARRLLDEARIVAALSHENVVRIIEVGEEHGTPIMALEYVHGENAGTLRNRAAKQERPIPVVVVARIIADVARGLHHAHTATDVEGRHLRVVHRDVAPKNIFVGVDGHSKIGDFGIATAAERLARTATGAVTGTLSYMSPEQLSSKPLTGRSDQWSLGVVLWELLTGHRLFKADSPVDVVEGILHTRLRSPRRLRDGIPRELSDITKTMLEREPGQRFPDLDAVANAIEGALPECVGAVGQAAVAAFVEHYAGDELRDRLRRIEEGGESTRADRVPDSVRSRSGSGQVQLAPTTAGRASASASGSSAVPVAPMGSSLSSLPSSSGLSAPPHTNTGSASAPQETVSGQTRTIAEAALVAPPRRRAPLVMAAAAVMAAVGGGAALYVKSLPPDPQTLTLRYLEKARPGRALVLREEILEEAREDGIEEVRVDGVAVELSALCNDRLDLLLDHWRKDEDARIAATPALTAAEQKLEDRVESRLKGLLAGQDPTFIADLLDLWAEECWGPVRWLAPAPEVELQANVQDRIVPQIEDTLSWREAVVRRLLKRADVDVEDVFGALWPMVTERQALIGRYGRVPRGEMDNTLAQIQAVERRGRAMLSARLPASYASAVAQVAFIDFDAHGAWVPLFGYLPSVKAKEPGAR